MSCSVICALSNCSRRPSFFHLSLIFSDRPSSSSGDGLPSLISVKRKTIEILSDRSLHLQTDQERIMRKWRNLKELAEICEFQLSLFLESKSNSSDVLRFYSIVWNAIKSTRYRLKAKNAEYLNGDCLILSWQNWIYVFDPLQKPISD